MKASKIKWVVFGIALAALIVLVVSIWLFRDAVEKESTGRVMVYEECTRTI